MDEYGFCTSKWLRWDGLILGMIQNACDLCLGYKDPLIVGIFMGREVWFKTGMLNSGLIFMGLFFVWVIWFRDEFDVERCFLSWFVLWRWLFKGLVEGKILGGLRLWMSGKRVWEWCIFRISGDFGEFYNYQTIRYMYWLRDILMVRRSDCRTRFMNCVWIWNNFGMVWCMGLRWGGFWS